MVDFKDYIIISPNATHMDLVLMHNINYYCGANLERLILFRSVLIGDNIINAN